MHKARADGRIYSGISSQPKENDMYKARTGNNDGISSKLMANFNIFLKRKDDLEVEVGKLLISSKNEQIQPTTLKLKANDLKSKLTSLNIEKWINDDKLCYFDPIDLCNWEDRIGKDIATVLYQTEDEINIRKRLAQSGIKKRRSSSFFPSYTHGRSLTRSV